ncbi:MAG: GAF domain-containing protein, partial [Treponema sp.]|nr:GAF domain-containing protein [Treponema sp.]
MMLNVQLRQQELTSEISQSFISRAPMETLIKDALRRTGEFLKVTRIVIARADRETENSRPVYTWFSEEKWRPQPVKAGFNDIINNTFPGRIPPKGYVPTVFISDIYNEADGRYRIFETVDLKSFIWAPLYVDGDFWGLLSVEECVKERRWSAGDIQLAATVSSAVAGAVARDLMDGERAEALEQAVQASQAKSNFLSNMSHEMRTPMNAIIGMTSIGKAAADIEKKDYCLEKIEAASTHLLGVINDILDMSKIEANKLELSPISFEFEKMLQKVVNVINFRVDEQQQSFYVTIDRNIPCTLIGDDQRLSQVITNLLSNAVKFTPKGGTIRLNAHLLSEQNNLCTIQIEVSDTGIGISEEQQSRLFNSFEQAESSTTRKFGGTGLGLAISKRIVEMMGGEIRIASEPGKGSAFS